MASQNSTILISHIYNSRRVVLELMKKKGVYTKKHVQEITDKQGSVQHVNWLTEDEKQAKIAEIKSLLKAKRLV